MDLHTFLLNLPKEEREPFAIGCGTTFGRLRQIGYGNEPASVELCTAIDRESKGVVAYREVNDAWEKKKGETDTAKRIPMDWDHIEERAREIHCSSNADDSTPNCHTPDTSIPGTPIDGAKVREAKNGTRKIPTDVKGVMS